MIDYLKDLLEDLEEFREEDGRKEFTNYYQKVFALKTAIEILEDIKFKERREKNGSTK